MKWDCCWTFPSERDTARGKQARSLCARVQCQVGGWVFPKGSCHLKAILQASLRQMEPVGNTSSYLLYRSGIGETFGNAVWPIMQKAYHGLSCVRGLFITATLAQEKARFTRWKRQRGKTGWEFQKTRLEGLLSTSARAPPPLREESTVTRR